MHWTDQQQAIIDAASRRERGRVLAYAGTGKTTTLQGVASASPNDRMLYLAFNRITAEEARAKFPRNVTAKTAHALALSDMRPWVGRREIVGSWWRLRSDIEASMGDVVAGARVYGRSTAQAFSAIAGTLQSFCQSAEKQLAEQHVPRKVLDPIMAKVYQEIGVDDDWTAKMQEREIRRRLSQAAAQVWEAVQERNDWPVTHDCYLKRWQLSEPTLRADVIAFDEAQDANPVMQDVVLRQPGRVWMVGDSYQAIYGWRGAIDALDQFDAKAYPLSQSFRFGPTVAKWANKILVDVFETDIFLEGLGSPGRVIFGGECEDDPGFESESLHRTAILCRSNIGVVRETIAALDEGAAVAIAGGAQGVADLIESAVALYLGSRPRHPDLRDFESWNDLKVLSEAPGGESWKPFVDLVERNPDDASRSASRLRRETVTEAAATTIISTAHKGKGRQWPIVRMGADWKPFQGVDEVGNPWVNETEARLWYVAMTRPTHMLDMTAAHDAWKKSIGGGE